MGDSLGGRLFDIGHLQATLVVLLSVLLPLSIFVGRRNVRIRRLRMLDNLGRALASPAVAGQAPVPPGFDLIRARYMDGAEGGPAWRRAWSWLKEIGIYALPAAIFVLLSGCGFALVVGLGGEWLDAAQVLLRGLRADDGAALDFATTTALVLGAGFVGSYIWSINYLILRVANFDLSPLSFLRTSAHVLMTVFVAWVLRQVVGAPEAGEKVAVAALLGIAFLSGLYPSLGLNVLVDRLPNWLRLKRDVAEAKEIGRSFPVDLVDGVDASIKFRLNQLEIADAQNLAAANPIELFVEVPYGLPVIVDWMAQAQLLIELGPQRFLAARAAGVRDMAAFLQLGRDEAGLKLLRPLLAPEGGAAADDPALLRARFESVAGKLHVRNLERWGTLLSQALDTPLPAGLQAPQLRAVGP